MSQRSIRRIAEDKPSLAGNVLSKEVKQTIKILDPEDQDRSPAGNMNKVNSMASSIDNTRLIEPSIVEPRLNVNMKV